MSKTLNNFKKNNGQLSKKDQVTFNRSINRNLAIENEIPNFKHKIHKTQKDYSRSRFKRFDLDEI